MYKFQQNRAYTAWFLRYKNLKSWTRKNVNVHCLGLLKVLCSWHSARDVQFLSWKTLDFISPLTWLPSSPHLNPVEYEVSGVHWVHRRRLYRPAMSTIKQRLQSEWRHFMTSSTEQSDSGKFDCVKWRPFWIQTVTGENLTVEFNFLNCYMMHFVEFVQSTLNRNQCS